MIPKREATAKRNRTAGAAALALALCLALAGPLEAAHRTAARGSGGAVASGDAAATAIGLGVLERGGNAVDSAVATALALAVTLPEAGNLGGGGFALVKLDGELVSLDFRETAPAAARRDLYLDGRGEPIADASLIGPLAAGVPGSPRGLRELHRRFGRLEWRELVAPAERLARGGFEVSPKLHASLSTKRELLARFPETAAVWLPDGEPPAIGSLLVQERLADSLKAYGEEGPAALSRGPRAAALVAAVRRHGGILTLEDLDGYRPVWRRPVRHAAFGWEIASMDLPSSGGIILGQTLSMLERIGWSGKPRFGADRAHLLAEAWRRSFADRYRLGDPASTEADSAALLAADWIAHRASGIRLEAATPSTAVEPFTGEELRESAATTHLSVIDAEGGIVALTTTLNGLYGCGLAVAEVGYFLNNEMDDFNTAPGRPNLYGLVQGEANSVLPGHRMLSSMTPTIAWRGGEALALGGRGGSWIPTATAQVLLNLIVDEDPLQAAVSRARLHHQWLPDRISVEPDRLSPETRAELERRGHRIELEEKIGKVHAVRRLADGRLEAASDPRAPGTSGVVVSEPR